MANEKIFIVEDSIIVSLHLQRTLESEGYHVIGTASSGRAAIERIEQEQPNLVLMDIMLDGELDGIETATIVKNKFNVPIVYITALTDSGTIQRAKVTEPYGYLTKPFEDREIFTVIEIALYKFEAETRLKRSEERFFSTLKSISDGVITIDNQFTISYINPSAESVIEISGADCQGKSIFDVFKLKSQVTNEFPVNPLQCELNTSTRIGIREGFMLVSNSGKEVPIGEVSINHVVGIGGNSAGLVITFKDITDKLEREKLMEIIERKRLIAQIEGQENERRRIAKDLHDGLGQMLNAIKMNINIITQHAEKARDLNCLLDEAINETKRISENLLPSKIRDFGLATNLKSLCYEVEQSTQVPVAFHKLGEIRSLTNVVKINLYRIAQEAITNAVRHGNPSHIVVQISEEHGKLLMTIEDDGTGFKLSAEDEALHQNGLINMRDRARILNGTVSIESDPNRGTVILVEVPVDNVHALVEIE
jgi:PAS domain S-box-containing protein